jgi:hypothetical protein
MMGRTIRHTREKATEATENCTKKVSEFVKEMRQIWNTIYEFSSSVTYTGCEELKYNSTWFRSIALLTHYEQIKYVLGSRVQRGEAFLTTLKGYTKTEYPNNGSQMYKLVSMRIFGILSRMSLECKYFRRT